jgi:hypothetical protein
MNGLAAFPGRRQLVPFARRFANPRAPEQRESFAYVRIARVPFKKGAGARGGELFCYRNIDELIQRYAFFFCQCLGFSQERNLQPQCKIARSHRILTRLQASRGRIISIPNVAAAG